MLTPKSCIPSLPFSLYFLPRVSYILLITELSWKFLSHTVLKYLFTFDSIIQFGREKKRDREGRLGKRLNFISHSWKRKSISLNLPNHVTYERTRCCVITSTLQNKQINKRLNNRMWKICETISDANFVKIKVIQIDEILQRWHTNFFFWISLSQQ